MFRGFGLYFYIILGALAGVLSFSYNILWWLIFFAPLPLFWLLYKHTEYSKKRLFFLGLLWGFVFFGGVIFWFWHTLPLDWLGITDPVFEKVAVFVYWSTAALVLGLFPALWLLAARVLQTRTSFDLALLPALWVIFEYARLWGFSLFMYGDNALLGPHFSFGLFGYTLAEHAFLRSFASLGGVYLLSFIAFLGASALAWFLFGKEKKRAALFAASAAVALALSALLPPFTYGTQAHPERTIRAAAIQTDFPPKLRGEIDATRRFLALENTIADIRKAGEDPGLIVFPEDSRFLVSFFPEKKAVRFFNALLDEKERVVIDSSRIFNLKDGVRLRMQYVNTKTGEVVTQDKQFLVPQGEYIPIFYKIIWKLSGKGGFLEQFARRRSYMKGDALNIGEWGRVKAGALFCSDILSPVLYRGIAKKNPEILVNVSSHSWFHHSLLLSKEMENVAQIRAAEQGRYLVRATNASPALVIDATGEVQKRGKRKGEMVLFATATPRTGQTPYTRFGDLILLFALFFIVLHIVMQGIIPSQMAAKTLDSKRV